MFPISDIGREEIDKDLWIFKQSRIELQRIEEIIFEVRELKDLQNPELIIQILKLEKEKDELVKKVSKLSDEYDNLNLSKTVENEKKMEIDGLSPSQLKLVNDFLEDD